VGKGLIERWIADPRASPHLAIVGGTGAGKTTLAKKIALNLLLSGKSLVILDFDGEYDLPLETLSPPFPLPKGVPLAWLLSQASRPEEGGGFGIAGVISEIQQDEVNIDEAISQLRHDFSIPYNVRFAALWRLRLLKRYFTASESLPVARFNLAEILDIRERQVVEQILASLAIVCSDARFIIIEEGIPGDWLADLLILARRRAKRIVYVGQSLPKGAQNFEIILFTPYISNPHPQLPLPVNPMMDHGVWWVGRLGVHRIRHTW
jgi:hypothetical protein